MDYRKLRQTFGLFTTGVIVVCGNNKIRGRDHLFGITINSFSSVSLEPALLLFSVDNRSSHLSFFKNAKYFSLNVLAADQLDLAKAFSSNKSSKKWEIEGYNSGKFGSPIFPNSLAFFECKKNRVIKAGDHHVFIGQIIDFQQLNSKAPLTFFSGSYQ